VCEIIKIIIIRGATFVLIEKIGKFGSIGHTKMPEKEGNGERGRAETFIKECLRKVTMNCKNHVFKESEFQQGKKKYGRLKKQIE
jgi:hypothetical protein